MKQCPHCHKDLLEDAIFCTYCGKPVEKVKSKDLEKIEEKISQGDEKQSHLKKNPRINQWGKIGIFLFFIALIICDFILATILGNIGASYQFVFIISFVLYILAIICGILSFVTDYQDKRRGFEANGSFGFSMVCIVPSLYIALTNLTTIILK